MRGIVLGRLFILAGVVAAPQGRAADQVAFRPHVVDPKLPGGYAVAAADLNKDGRTDLIGISLRLNELPWYENPTWTRRILVDGLSSIVNVATNDLDEDGIPEMAVQSGFAMTPAKSEGLVWLLKHRGDPRARWQATLVDRFSTSHHLAWADIDGDGRRELINAPLVGAGSAGPTYDQDRVPLLWYRPTDWRRRVIDATLGGILHRVRPVFWDEDGREELLVAGFDGIVLYRSVGTGDGVTWHRETLSPGHQASRAPRLGASDVAVGRLGNQRLLAAVEPWHGNEVVLYMQGAAGTWTRRVLFDGLVEGHEVAVADLNGDGRDDVVAGDRSAKGSGVHLFYAPADPVGPWSHQVLDAGEMTASGCITADLNGDGRPDLACIGSTTANLKWYENLGPRR